MTKVPQVHLRPARRDDISALVSWLNAPALLAAANVAPLTQVEQSVARSYYEHAIQKGSCSVVVSDNIRIGAILWNPDINRVNGHSIHYLPRLRLDWLRLLPEILTEYGKSADFCGDSTALQVSREAIVTNQPDEDRSSVSTFRVSGKRVLLLGPVARNEWPVRELRKHGYEVAMGSHHDEILNKDPFDLIVSSGYHLRIPHNICSEFAGKIVNIHAARLPWGRGIGTTLFAVLLRYPLGSSIHLIDSGLDTGPLLCETDTTWSTKDTLRTIYDRLILDANSLFARFLADLAAEKSTYRAQRGLDARAYSRNRLQFETVLEICPLGYDTPLGDIVMLSEAMQCLTAVRNDVRKHS